MEIHNPQRVKYFWSKVNKNGPIHPELGRCWIWTGAISRGYGNFTVAKGQTGKAHRFSYLLHWGFLGDYQVDHKCCETRCINPHHLQLLTNKENNEKSTSPSAINKRKTHCIHGHEFIESNIIRYKDGHRRCKTCLEERIGFIVY
jgi:HNH endonuclease